MTRRLVAAASVLLLAGLASAACTGTETGSATPVATSGNSPTSSSAESASSSPSTPRPKDLDLAGVNPCKLIPEAQRASLKISTPESGPDDIGDGVTQCVLTPSDRLAGNNIYSYGVFANTSVGARDFVASSGGPAEENKDVQVSGYSVTLTPASETVACFAVADTDDGQNLTIQVLALDETDREALCSLAEPVMQIALDTLAQLQP